MSNMKTHSRFTKINSYDVTHQSTTQVERTQHFYGFHSSVNQKLYATLSDVAVSVWKEILKQELSTE